MNPIICQMIARSGRSWWQVRYADGKVVSEWDTTLNLHGLIPLAIGRTSRWEEVPKKGMIGLRLLCPNGMAGELEASEGHRFFQLKLGNFEVATTGTIARRYMVAHIIGVVLSADGNCLCRAWEEYERITSPEFEQAEELIRHLANKDDIAKAQARLASFYARGYGRYKWRLTEFTDNVFNMKYRQIGKLNLDVQQLKI